MTYDATQRDLKIAHISLNSDGTFSVGGLVTAERQLAAEDARRDAAELAEVARHAAADQDEHPALPDPAGWQ